MDKFSELGIDIGRQFIRWEIAAENDFGVDFNEVRLHAQSATCFTVARGTGTAQRERNCDSAANQVGAGEAAMDQMF